MDRRPSIINDQRGITAAVAVVSLLGIFAAATLSVDAGNAWQSRRNIVTATDAAALAEAGELAFNESSSCIGLFHTVLENNAGTDVYDRSCTLERQGSGIGYVFVESRKPIDVRFGVVVGLDDTNAYSLSAAQFGYPTGATGLRPMAFCSQNLHVQIWRSHTSGSLSPEDYEALKGAGDVNGDGRIDFPADEAYASHGVVHRMFFDKSIDDGACGTFPGNWGWLSFDGLPSNTGDRNTWIRKGYSGDVKIRVSSDPPCPGSPGSGDEDDSAEGCIPADSGELATNNADALTGILGKPIYIGVFDAGSCQGGGTTCTFESWAFVGVILRGFKDTGTQASRYFDFEYTDIQVSGQCCSAAPPTEDLGARGVKLCAVDHDTVSLVDRCALD